MTSDIPVSVGSAFATLRCRTACSLRIQFSTVAGEAPSTRPIARMPMLFMYISIAMALVSTLNLGWLSVL